MEFWAVSLKGTICNDYYSSDKIKYTTNTFVKFKGDNRGFSNIKEISAKARKDNFKQYTSLKN